MNGTTPPQNSQLGQQLIDGLDNWIKQCAQQFPPERQGEVVQMAATAVEELVATTAMSLAQLTGQPVYRVAWQLTANAMLHVERLCAKLPVPPGTGRDGATAG